MSLALTMYAACTSRLFKSSGIVLLSAESRQYCSLPAIQLLLLLANCYYCFQARASAGDQTLQQVLDDVNELRKSALELGKTAAMACKLKDKRVEILEIMDAGYADMEQLFQQVYLHIYIYIYVYHLQ
jgi:hypothetical protein